MTDDKDESGKGDDEVDPGDWLSKQFGVGDAAEEPKPAFPEPPTLNNPLEAPSASASPHFSWGLKPGVDSPASNPAESPRPPLVFPLAEPAPPSTAPPVESPATELLSAGDATVVRPAEPASTIDSLFGEKQFKDYDGEPLIGAIPFVAKDDADAARSAKPPRAASGPLPRSQKIALWIGGGIVAILLLVVLFLLGTKLPDLLGAAPAVATSNSPSPTPSVAATSTPPAVGPVPVGEHKWNALLGGECLDPFPSPWAEKFTVVDCATPHAAQMVFRGRFPDAAPAAGATATPNPYPGMPALQAQINLLCTAPGVIDLPTAGAYSDIQFQATYPVTEKEWADGYHDYFCFVSRSSAGPITGSVATPHPAG